MDENQIIDLNNTADHLIGGMKSLTDQSEENQIISDVPPGYTDLSASILLGSSFP